MFVRVLMAWAQAHSLFVLFSRVNLIHATANVANQKNNTTIRVIDWMTLKIFKIRTIPLRHSFHSPRHSFHPPRPLTSPAVLTVSPPKS